MNDDPIPWVDSDLVREILDHLTRHPHAADTSVGVARWWLGPRAATVALRDVEMALGYLVARHKLRHELLADGTTLYSRDWKHSLQR